MTNETVVGQNMMLHSRMWQDVPTFSLIPVTQDCPYSEAIYDRQTGVLAIISNKAWEKPEMLPRLDADGNLTPIKKKGSKENAGFKQQRVLLKLPKEYFINGEDEIEKFIKLFAVNHKTFNFKELLEKVEKPKESAIIKE